MLGSKPFRAASAPTRCEASPIASNIVCGPVAHAVVRKFAWRTKGGGGRERTAMPLMRAE